MLPKLTEIRKTGDASCYEYLARDGSKHNIVITEAEQAAIGVSLFDMVRDRIQRIEKDVARSAET